MLGILVVDNLGQDTLKINKEVNKQDKAVEDTLAGNSLVEHIWAVDNLVLDILIEDTLEDSKKENKRDIYESRYMSILYIFVGT